VLNIAGTVKDSIGYDGFGGITSETDSSFRGRYAWTGREINSEIELQYNRARYYDAGTGRWISQDPLGFDAGDSNLYRYVRNVSTILADPSGLQQEPPSLPSLQDLQVLWQGFLLDYQIAVVQTNLWLTSIANAVASTVTSAAQSFGQWTSALNAALTQKLTVQQVQPPFLGTYGAFIWPVRFKLSHPAHKDNGGWMVQHVVREVRVNGAAPAKIPDLDYWEAWRVPKGLKAPNLHQPSPQIIDAAKQLKIGDISQIAALDWFGTSPVPTPACSSGSTTYTGKVYFLDNMTVGQMPWKPNTVKEAGGLRSIYTAGNEMKIQALLNDFKAIGPVPHNITVTWSSGAPKTVVTDKDP